MKDFLWSAVLGSLILWKCMICGYTNKSLIFFLLEKLMHTNHKLPATYFIRKKWLKGKKGFLLQELNVVT